MCDQIPFDDVEEEGVEKERKYANKGGQQGLYMLVDLVFTMTIMMTYF